MYLGWSEVIRILGSLVLNRHANRHDGRHDAWLEGCCPNGCHTTPALLLNTTTMFDADIVNPVAPVATLLCPKSIRAPPLAAEEPVKGCFAGEVVLTSVCIEN